MYKSLLLPMVPRIIAASSLSTPWVFGPFQPGEFLRAIHIWDVGSGAPSGVTADVRIFSAAPTSAPFSAGVAAFTRENANTRPGLVVLSVSNVNDTESRASLYPNFVFSEEFRFVGVDFTASSQGGISLDVWPLAPWLWSGLGGLDAMEAG